jgi:2-keto-4-pentenoate hydratase/2-oxohepta-3-ene-1,7-dioic acid hydratase in catechol pathway
MKIIAVGRNYAEHAHELNNPVPLSPIIFMKPDTAVLKDNKPFYHPEFSAEIHHEIELVLKIAKEGKHIPPQFASNYFDEISIGIDFTARDMQQKCKENAWPWELAKSFDHSAPVGRFISKTNFSDLYHINFKLDINGQTKQHGDTQNLIFPFENIISFVSQHITLKKGDLIFTGTPQGVGKINIGDHLEGYLVNEKLLDFYIR